MKTNTDTAKGATATSETKTVKLKLYATAAEINTAISKIARAGQKLQKEIHLAAVSCLAHADKHGDITLMQKLVAALPTLARKNALLVWACHFGKFGLDSEDTSKLIYVKAAKTDIIGATKMPFWEFTPEPALKPFNFGEALGKLLQQVERHEKKPVEGDVMPTADQVRLVRDLHKLIAPAS